MTSQSIRSLHAVRSAPVKYILAPRQANMRVSHLSPAARNRQENLGSGNVILQAQHPVQLVANQMGQLSERCANSNAITSDCNSREKRRLLSVVRSLKGSLQLLSCRRPDHIDHPHQSK